MIERQFVEFTASGNRIIYVISSIKRLSLNDTYPERYKLSSGAKLKSFRIPNTLNPFAYITTLFNGIEFDTFAYMGNDLLKQYEDGELTEHEIVNQLFSPWEQIDQSQHPLLTSFLQAASRGVATPKVGTGSGGSTSQSSWDGREHDPSRRKR